jgi:flavin reductase (DIM6/NTAB) family NADH-FMN oxidoreductase RutF
VPTLEASDFRAACARFATGVAIVTVRTADGTPHGLTVSSFTSVSINPPLILVCLDYGCTILPHFRENPHFAINILGESQQELSVIFSAKPEGRFEGLDWAQGKFGSPLFPGSLAHLENTRESVVEAGDHAILIGRVQSVHLSDTKSQGKPLLYFNRSYRSLM